MLSKGKEIARRTRTIDLPSISSYNWEKSGILWSSIKVPIIQGQFQHPQTLQCLWGARIISRFSGGRIILRFLLLEKETSYPQRGGGNMLRSLSDLKIEGFSEAGNL